ncbi:MAG: diguanylate cyclase, partial [Pseudomonadota bacterium]
AALGAAANTLLQRSADQLARLAALNEELEKRVTERTAALSMTTDRMRAQTAEREAAELRAIELAAFVSENPEPAMRIGRDDLVVYANPAARRVLDVHLSGPGRLAPEAWRDAMQAARSGFDVPLVRETVGEHLFNLRFARAEDEVTINVYGRDVTVEARAEANAVRAATHDPHTELPTRSMFMARMQTSLAQARAAGKGVAVFTIGLKAFADVNERHGFDGGDVALKTIAQRLRGVARPEDDVARVGGDEFAIIAVGVPHVDAVAGAVARFAEAFVTDVPIDGTAVPIAAAIGVSYVAHAEVEKAEIALKQSGQAMLRAKDGAGTTSAFFDAALDAEANEARRIAGLIRAALDGDGFELRYQPKIGVHDGRLL